MTIVPVTDDDLARAALEPQLLEHPVTIRIDIDDEGSSTAGIKSFPILGVNHRRPTDRAAANLVIALTSAPMCRGACPDVGHRTAG